MTVLKAVVVGCGWAGYNHALAYATNADCQLVAVCDIDPARAKHVASLWDIHAYDDIHVMLTEEQPDIVSIATREYDHEGPAIMALNMGANVFCEKIMAHSLEAGEHMVATAAREHKVLGVNYNYRHVPTLAALRAYLASDTHKHPPVLVAKTHSYCWHHMVDLLRFFLGEPVGVQATLIDHPRKLSYPWHSRQELLYVPTGAVAATFRFASGALATVIATAYVNFEECMMDVALYGEDGCMRLNNICPKNVSGEPTYWSSPGVFEACSRVTLEETFKLSIRSFVEALRDGRCPVTTGEDGLAAMCLEHAVVRAARTGLSVKVQEV